MSQTIKALTLKDLPAPPTGRDEFPWTEQGEPMGNRILDGSKYPRISIITPSYNQGHFIEETIQSVLTQDYPNVEYIIIDGGSTDQTVEIIKKYEDRIAYWVSEPDRGQAHAINKGLAKSTGEVWSYLNSDDLLNPGSLHRVSEIFQDLTVSWVGGVSSIFDDAGIKGYVTPAKVNSPRDYLTPWSRSVQYVFPCSNVNFMRREILAKCGYFNENYHYGMDIEYYIRVIFRAKIDPYLIHDVLGKWRWHDESKTFKQGLAYGFREDEVKMAELYSQYLNQEEQIILLREIQEQRKWLVPRKALFYINQGDIDLAFVELFFSVFKDIRLLVFRPWYGALKILIKNFFLL